MHQLKIMQDLKYNCRFRHSVIIKPSVQSFCPRRNGNLNNVKNRTLITSHPLISAPAECSPVYTTGSKERPFLPRATKVLFHSSAAG